MDDYDFERIDREVEEKSAKDAGYVWEYDRWAEIEHVDQDVKGGTVKYIGLFHEDIKMAKTQRAIEIANFGKNDIGPLSPDWNPQIELLDIRPEQFELVPIGSYGSENLPPNTTILDDSYTVYLRVPNPEYDCEVILR